MISRTLADINAQFKESPYEINNGLCEDWAILVVQQLLGKEKVEVWETVWGYSDTSHIFLRINGLFYDAECLIGVTDHMELPLFKKLSKRQPVWMIENHHGEQVSDNRRDITDEQVKQYYANEF